MSAPQVTVVFQDEEGDEFPYRVYATAEDSDGWCIARGFRLIATDMDHGDVRPTGEVSVKRIER